LKSMNGADLLDQNRGNSISYHIVIVAVRADRMRRRFSNGASKASIGPDVDRILAVPIFIPAKVTAELASATLRYPRPHIGCHADRNRAQNIKTPDLNPFIIRPLRRNDELSRSDPARRRPYRSQS
jgi:hypothetical protein